MITQLILNYPADNIDKIVDFRAHGITTLGRMELRLWDAVWGRVGKYYISEMMNMTLVVKKREPITKDRRLKRKMRILTILARAADDSECLILTREEMVALVRGDIGRIESWLDKLDKRHPIRLWHQLS